MLARLCTAVCAIVVAIAATTGVAAPVAAAPTQTPTTYTNPVGVGRHDDPFVVRSGSTFYAYLSGLNYGLPIYGLVRQSTDLVTWTNVGAALTGPGAWADGSSGYNVASPSVVNVPANPASEQWVMYYTGLKAGSSTTCIGVATASSPAGPFTPKDSPILCPPEGAEDPSVHRPYGLQLAYVSDGTIYNQGLVSTGLAVSGTRFPLYAAQPGWWQEGIVDRPAVVAGEGNTRHLLFSGGPKNTARRAMGSAPCKTVWTVVVDCSSPTTLGPWIEGDDGVAGPTGAQAFTDAAGAQWIAYTARPGGACTPSSCSQNPVLHIDKLCFAHGHPRTNGPSTGAQSLARDAGDCSADVPGAPLAIDPATDVTDDGTTVPLALDGNVTTAAHGRALWVFGDRFDCGNRSSNWGGFGIPHEDATGPHFVQDTPDCEHPSHGGIIQKTQAEKDYDTSHWTECTPPPAGSCETRSRIVLWSGGAVGLPDGGAWVTFSKAIERYDWVEQENGQFGWEFAGWEGVGIGAVNVSRANIDAGIAVGDRSPSTSPVGCGLTAATAEGCLFDTEVDPTGSDSFDMPIADGGHVYMMSSAAFRWILHEGDPQTWPTGCLPADPPDGDPVCWEIVQTAWPKLARAPIGQVDDLSAWRYWTGPGEGDWSSTNDYAAAAALPSTDLAAGSVTYNPYLDQFVALNDFLGSVSARTAPSLTAAWSPPVDVMTGVRCSGDAMAVRTFAQHSALTTRGGRTLPISYYTAACPAQLRWATVRLDG